LRPIDIGAGLELEGIRGEGENPVSINLGPLQDPPVDALPVEIVERKGLGHPDSICDSLAEEVSMALCRFYREQFGFILHHNVDKILLSGGEAQPAFGGGSVTKPIEIFIAGRATSAFKGVAVPVEELAVEAARAWLRDNLHALDVERHVRLHSLIKPGSQELVALYLKGHREGVWLANDTSCGVGYAPLDALETTVLRTEQHLSSKASTDSYPEIGEDIKVMGVRHDGGITLTVACAMIGRQLKNIDDYAAKKAAIAERVIGVARDFCNRDVLVHVNSADDLASGSIYLTVTGTSAEAGDDGEAGRGNRVNGLITPYRSTTMESVAGKNPVTHVGKLYNLCVGLIADAIVRRHPEVISAACSLVSEIGRPIDQPEIVDVRVRTADGRPLVDLAPSLTEIARDQLGRIHTICDDLLDGRLVIDDWPLRAGAVASG
jgi:S-adenosylmethionine synthetase